MSWNVEQTGDAQTSTSASYGVALPADHDIGDRVVVNVSCSLATGDAIAWPDDWHVISEGNIPTTTHRQFVRYHDVTGEESWFQDDAPTITLSGSSNHGWSHTSHRIRGGAGSAPEATAATGNNASPDPGSVTPTWGAKNTLFLALLSYQTGQSTVNGVPADLWPVEGITRTQLPTNPLRIIPMGH